MKILVYDVAASAGGALSVLRDYHKRALVDAENEYFFVVSTPSLDEAENTRVLRYPFVKRSWISRLRFDITVLPALVREIDPDRILSLQNTTVPFAKQEQWVYMHNLLPKGICDIDFSLRSDPFLWIYQNLIGRIIVRSLKRAQKIIVQSNWLKNRISRTLGIPADRILVEKPAVQIFSKEVEREAKKSSGTTFVYPSAASSYKNHRVILDAVRALKKDDLNDYRVIFTLDGSENALSKALKAECEAECLPIEFLGFLDKEEMGRAYAESDVLLFPSRLETWGLPLQEAQLFNLTIFASDLDYAHETVGEYSKAAFFDPVNPKELAALMKTEIDSHPRESGERA